ncbi:MAG: DUF1565 domain-containing protein, partial [Candidatus Saccharibacteria bacterium]|nr:DUF1565 domain-containing protein [Candidatus Saccharibacteria bacterium]
MFVPSVFATTYYVSSSGTDIASGVQDEPWKTIQKAANTLVAGDVVNVSAGTYEEVVAETSSGSSGSLIKFQANGEVLIRGFNLNGNYIELNGFTVTPSGTCQVNWNGAIQSSGSNNVIVNNTVKDSIITGLKLTPTANSNLVSHNTIVRANVDGMTINGTNHTIENNDISDIRNIINGCSWHGDTNAITFFGSGSVY